MSTRCGKLQILSESLTFSSYAMSIKSELVEISTAKPTILNRYTYYNYEVGNCNRYLVKLEK